MKANRPWGFRVASGVKSGRGHMVRCLALARVLPEQSIFYLDEPTFWEDELIAGKHGFQKEALTDGATAMFAARDAGEIGAFLFDGYSFSPTLVQEAVQRGFCVEIRDYPGEMLAHVTIAPFWDGGESGLIKHKSLLSGPPFALLDARFGDIREKAFKKSVSVHAKNILLAFGAFDSGNITGKILEHLAPQISGVMFTVLLGRYAPHLDKVRSIVGSLENAQLIVDEQDMPSLYLGCDMAIGAGGVSMLERMCLGVPSIIITTAENQVDQVRFAVDSEAVIHAGQLASIDFGALKQIVKNLAGDVARRTNMRQKGMNYIDGKGALRVSERITSFRTEFERMQ